MKGNLPRLDSVYYQGRAYVFWTHTTANRERFQLGDTLHYQFREVLCHICARYEIAVPVYCIMPDHVHMLWIGRSVVTDQKKATALFRREFGKIVAPVKWQRQAHDHVVREDERASGIYSSTIDYILQNPVRGALCEKWEEYPYLGAMIAGYPQLDRRDPKFNSKFWAIVSAS